MNKKSILYIAVILLLSVGVYVAVEQDSNVEIEIPQQPVEIEQNDVSEEDVEFDEVENIEYVPSPFTSEYDPDKELIYFYKDGELINTFDIQKNNPFELDKRKKFSDRHYEFIKSDKSLFEYDANKHRPQELYSHNVISNTSSVPEEEYLKKNRAVNYTGTLRTKGLHYVSDAYDIAEISFIKILDKRGDVVKEFVFKNSTIIDGISPNLHYAVGTSNNILGPIGNPEAFLLNIETGENITSIIPIIDELRLGYHFFSGIFLPNNTFFATVFNEKASKEALLIINFNDEIFYYKEINRMEGDYFDIDFNNSLVRFFDKRNNSFINHLNFQKLE